MNNSIDVLRTLSPFAELAESELARIAEATTQHMLSAGTVLFRQGDPPDALFVLRSGLVALCRGQECDGDMAIVEIVRPTEYLALAAFALGCPCGPTAKAIAPSVVLRIGAAPLRTLLNSEPLFAGQMLAALARQNRLFMRQLGEMKRRSAPQRLGCFLLALAKENANGGADAIELPCDKRSLSSRLGVAPEHLSRAFATLRRYGVTTHGRRVWLADPAALAAFARPDAFAEHDSQITPMAEAGVSGGMLHRPDAAPSSTALH